MLAWEIEFLRLWIGIKAKLLPARYQFGPEFLRLWIGIKAKQQTLCRRSRWSFYAFELESRQSYGGNSFFNVMSFYAFELESRQSMESWSWQGLGSFYAFELESRALLTTWEKSEWPSAKPTQWWGKGGRANKKGFRGQPRLQDHSTRLRSTKSSISETLRIRAPPTL